MIYKKIKTNTAKILKKQYNVFKLIFSKTNSIKIKPNKKSIVLSIALISALILPIFPFSTLTLAYEVKYDDVTLGYVAGESVVESAQDIVNDKIVGNVQTSPEYSVKLIANSSLNNAKEISEKIIDNTNIVEAFGIYVNEECITAGDSKSILLNILEQYKSSVLTESNADIAVFNENVEVKECLSLAGKLDTLAESLNAVKKHVNVKTGIYKTKTVKVPYRVINKEDSSLYKGITQTKTQGKNGKREIQTLNLYLNGKKVSTEIINKKTVEKAVNQIVLTGTKKKPNIKIKDGAKYVWPLETGSSSYISSGFGYRHSRLHKGIDICTAYGTQILAAMDGVVTRASWFESYGYCVDIRHSDGTLTRYAHCSSLIVKTGQKVVAGQTIARVGSTGRSTANHLHFEVRPNGADPVNPNNYVKK